MAWVNNAERGPAAEGEYKCLLQGRGKYADYERVCAYIPSKAGKKRGTWYSMTSGGKVCNVKAWYEEEEA